MKRPILALLPLLLVLSVVPWPVLAATPVPTIGDFDGFIELAGGRKIYAECTGEGGLTVLLVSGYRIRIAAGGETLEYHGSLRGQPFLCPPSRIQPPTVADPRASRDRQE